MEYNQINPSGKGGAECTEPREHGLCDILGSEATSHNHAASTKLLMSAQERMDKRF